ncbi:MAG: CDC48 family AAA ATPase [Proteobacteria bacterium]|nr:CDC48 family AAA ATPase [Pseudomonadota bacterium]
MDIKLKVTEALSKDVGRAYARVDPEVLKILGGSIGDSLLIKGKKQTICKAMPIYPELRGKDRVQLDGLSRENAGTSLDETIALECTQCRPAEFIKLAPIDVIPGDRDINYIGSLLDGLTVVVGDKIRATLFGNRSTEFRVMASSPNNAVTINPTTKLFITEPDNKTPGSGISYEEIGGLKSQLQRIRETIELPLRYPEVFSRLGISAPKGVLLHGPPGCGKTLIARAIANETEAAFFSINGPEIIHKFYGESEAHLRKIFHEAAKKSSSIIFIDEIDAIAPKRESAAGEVEKRVVAQLLASMDGLNRRSNTVVIAATNIPNVLDSALRRPGRFDREIAIPIPDKTGRQQILEIHSRGMPLSGSVELDHLAGITHGFVGADLEALCREAAMLSLRRLLPDIDFSMNQIPYDDLLKLEVLMDDFQEAFTIIEPSAIREVFVDVPNVRWEEVGGLTNVKKKLVETVEWPLKYPHLFEKTKSKPAKGILVYGPPGCGKTLVAKAAATESQANFISVKGPELISKYVGESEKSIRGIFHKARQAAPCIIFFDEIDALFCNRSATESSSGVVERILSQFLAEFDGIEELKRVLVMGATNRIDLLDDAVLRPGRFDEKIEVALPNQKEREEILAIYLSQKPYSDDIDVSTLAAKTQGYSGAEIESVCNNAALNTIRRIVGEDSPDSHLNSKPVIDTFDLDKAFMKLEKERGKQNTTTEKRKKKDK